MVRDTASPTKLLATSSVGTRVRRLLGVLPDVNLEIVASLEELVASRKRALEAFRGVRSQVVAFLGDLGGFQGCVLLSWQVRIATGFRDSTCNGR